MFKITPKIKQLQFDHIILWRHSQATDLVDLIQGDMAESRDIEKEDLLRPLTLKGQHQARRMAAWLEKSCIKNISSKNTSTGNANTKNIQIYSSPALRTFQTASAFRADVQLSNALKPEATLQQVLDFLSSIEHQKNIVIVGHQPWLGELAAHLLGLKQAQINIKKGAIWWLQPNFMQDKSMFANLKQSNNYDIFSVQTPKLL
jgi:phosphohistidine phosphatase